ncbi:MAG: RsmB/NOP family class I SAM-dependent RNA methyltransferase [Faecalicoccus sp.]|nr:RsmB/NOP family class I SAM-dependent RNA methyltransferase [Faecalicoccus sp.]
MKSLLQDEYSDYLKAMEDKKYQGLRINTLKANIDQLQIHLPYLTEKVEWTENGYYIPEDVRPGTEIWYRLGLYYLQEPSAMFPAAALPIHPGDYVLDLCAAPGGKSTELAAKLKGQGLLISNDISVSRCKPLLRNLELFGVDNMIVMAETPEKLAEKYPEFFDKILVDAPCSGEGMFRKDPALINSWTPDSNDHYASLQKEICDKAIQMLKPGGYLVYSTCTFSKKENEEIVQHMMEQSMEVVAIQAEGADEGFIPGTVRFFPHHTKGEGHFTALLKKPGTLTPYPSSLKAVKNPYAEKDPFFSLLKKDFYNGHFELKKEKLYFCRDIDTDSLRVLRSGLYLGDFKKNRFEPSQALAMALKKDEFKQVIDLDEQRALKYLKGETIDIHDINTSIKGWVLVCLDGYPMGFAKASKGTLKNKLDAGWRIQ